MLSMRGMLIDAPFNRITSDLRLFELPAGLLINFNVPKLTDGIRRLINPRLV